jgi:hypothetical protein
MQQFIWEPQPGPQTAFVLSDDFEVVYGGARGGGKTDATLGEFAMHEAEYGGNAMGLLVRRSRTALEPTIDRAKQIYLPLGATWHEQKSRFVWPSGATLRFSYLDRDSDADLYQGHSYTRVYIEELTQFVSPKPVDKLKATLRSAAGVPCGFRATCNPGGPGHNWVKARYIDPGPWRRRTVAGLSTMFIPAKVSDNPALDLADPLYRERLKLSGTATMVRAWLDGDWSVIEGAFFDGWATDRNVCKPFTIPDLWTRFRAFDWGYAAPFSCGWWAVATDEHVTEAGVTIPRGALVRYREWYGSTGKPNEGLRLTAEEVAQGIKQRDGSDTIAFGVADPSIFREDGGPSIAERMARAGGQRWRPADNTRVGKQGAFGGWDQMRARIKGTDDGPMLVVFETCRDFIRTVPVLQHDPDKPEDLDTGAEDHVADECRYACLSRPMVAKNPVKPNNPRDLGFGERPRQMASSWKTQ